MTARDEAREKCIDAIEAVLLARWDRAAPISLKRTASEVLDSLHGVANVCQIEATDEMIEAGFAASEDACDLEDTFPAMSDAGRLTNPPGEKS